MQEWYHERSAQKNESPTRRETSLLAKAIGAADMAIVIANEQDRIVWINHAFTRLTGYVCADLAGTPLRRLYDSPQALPAGERGAPARGPDEHERGELTCVRKDGTVFIADQKKSAIMREDGSVSHFVAVINDITESKRLARKYAEGDAVDFVTGLPGREQLFMAQSKAIDAARQTQTLMAVLFLDLDGFKAINDTYGHHIGDGMLRAVAQRLRGAVRGRDAIFRFGGDEFVILLGSIPQRDLAVRLAKKITLVLSSPYPIDGGRFHVGVSVGVAFCPDHGTTCESLLIKADQAMYVAKKSGGGRVHTAEPGAALPGKVGGDTDDSVRTPAPAAPQLRKVPPVQAAVEGEQRVRPRYRARRSPRTEERLKETAASAQALG